MKVGDVCKYLESLAPLSLQESYDNSGLLVGNKQDEVTGIVVALDAIEAVLDDAISRKCNMVVTHHPIVFSGLKSLTGKNYIERVVIKAIQNGIALYAIHTNLDNVSHGVNARIADKLGLQNTSILALKPDTLIKLQTYIPAANADAVRDAMFDAGAGHIGEYSHCSFSSKGTGSYMAGHKANPYLGERGELHKEEEVKIEVIVPRFASSHVVKALIESHPYEEVAYDIYAIEQAHSKIGAGMVGELEKPMSIQEFFAFLKRQMKVSCVRHTAEVRKEVQKIAVCGGSGSFLLSHAMRAEADVFVTADFKYHQFFDAEGRIVIADIGHFESEQYTQDLLVEKLHEKFPKFAVHFTEVNTNPINYF